MENLNVSIVANSVREKISVAQIRALILCIHATSCKKHGNLDIISYLEIVVKRLNKTKFSVTYNLVAVITQLQVVS